MEDRSKMDEQVNELNSLQNINYDVMLYICEFLSFTEWWSLSRSCKEYYALLNGSMYTMFMAHYYKIQPPFIDNPVSFDNYFRTRKDKWCIFTGSSVLAVLMGKKWYDDIDIFYHSGNVEIVYNHADYGMLCIDNGSFEEYDGQLRSLLSKKYVSENGIKLNIIHAYSHHDKTIESMIQNFDILACTSYINVKDRYVSIYNPKETLFGISAIKQSVYKIDNSVYQRNRYKRVVKYGKRGFSLYIDLANFYEYSAKIRQLQPT